MVILIDATSLASRLFHIMENNFNEQSFKNIFMAKIYDSISYLKASHCLVVFNDYQESNRKKIDVNYTYSPANHELIEKLLNNVSLTLQNKGVNCFSKNGCESRDIIASIHSKLTIKNIPITILSQDKSILSLVNSYTKIYDPMAKKDNKMFINREVFIDKYLFSPEKITDFLLLSGIKKYGIPGITGVGEKRAMTLINDYGTTESILENSQEIKGELGRNLRLELRSLMNNFKSFILLVDDIELGLSLKEIEYVSK